MPSIHLPYVNIAIDAFALVITIIILSSCIREFSSKRIGSKHFLILQISVVLALIADMIGWIGEGHLSLSVMTTVANTVASCMCQIAILCFLGYLTDNLYENSRYAGAILNVLCVFGVFSLAVCVGNAFWGYAFSVDSQGHYTHSENITMGVIYMAFPILAFVSIVIMSLVAKRSVKLRRASFIVYTLFPLAGFIIDHLFHGISVTYAGLTVGILSIYTSIYLTKQKQLEAQKNALMLSQINPHFIYNTLSTIASMCDTSPKQAKCLTIDFSQYLRRNIGTLTSEALIPFEQEMEHVECYLKIEKARFRERLNINYSINCKDFRLPPLTVQPLVENAIKHGITKRAAGGTVKISTRDDEINYIIEIIDDGIGFEYDSTEMHVGLQNVQNRVRAMCKGKVYVKSTVGVGTRVTIEIPKRKGNLI